MWIDLPEWAKNMKICVSHVNAHQRVTSAEEDFNIQVDRLTRCMDTTQPPLSSPSGLMNMATGAGVTHGFPLTQG